MEELRGADVMSTSQIFRNIQKDILVRPLFPFLYFFAMQTEMGNIIILETFQAISAWMRSEIKISRTQILA